MIDNAFDQACETEKHSLKIILPWLEIHSNSFVMTSKGRLSKELQKKYGDVFIQHKQGAIFTVEIKSENKWTGNLFLETFSNGSTYNPGWMYTLNADLLFYHFMDCNLLYIIKLDILKAWFFFGNGRKIVTDLNNNLVVQDAQYVPGYQRFPQKRQNKYNQKNDTWGVCVPIEIISQEVCGIKIISLNTSVV